MPGHQRKRASSGWIRRDAAVSGLPRTFRADLSGQL